MIVLVYHKVIAIVMLISCIQITEGIDAQIGFKGPSWKSVIFKSTGEVS